MQKLNNIKQSVAEHFDPDGKSLGFLNELEHLDLRIQIAENNISGYYVIIPDNEYFEQNGEHPKYNILPDGSLEDWCDGFYYEAHKLIFKLLKGVRKKLKNMIILRELFEKYKNANTSVSFFHWLEGNVTSISDLANELEYWSIENLRVVCKKIENEKN